MTTAESEVTTETASEQPVVDHDEINRMLKEFGAMTYEQRKQYVRDHVPDWYRHLISGTIEWARVASRWCDEGVQEGRERLGVGRVFSSWSGTVDTVVVPEYDWMDTHKDDEDVLEKFEKIARRRVNAWNKKGKAARESLVSMELVSVEKTIRVNETYLLNEAGERFEPARTETPILRAIIRTQVVDVERSHEDEVVHWVERGVRDQGYERYRYMFTVDNSSPTVRDLVLSYREV